MTVATNYGYDELHRLRTRTYAGDPSGTPSATFNYDESTAWATSLSNTVGRLSSESAGSTTGQIFGYDPMGRPVINWQCTPRVCGTTAYLLSYGYDLAGDLISASNGTGVTLSYSYNSAARLTGVTSNFVDVQHPATLLSNVHYNQFGLLSDTLGNGLNENMGYSPRGIPQSYSSMPYSFSLGLAANGSVTSGNDSVNGNWTYSYDNFNRLAGSNKNAGAQTFSYVYDRYGNRLQQNAPQGGPAPQYLFDNNNRISGSGVTYDALGNVLTDGLGNTYTYDAESRLIKVVNSVGTYNYTYNAEGQRVKTNAAEYLYDLSGRAITLFDPTSGVWNFGEIYAGGRHLATYSGSTTNFLHTDWLGTKRVMSNLSGTNSQTCTSLPFGDAQSCTGTEWSFNHFTDDIHDSESNLEHTWFRQLSGTQGRWASPDPYLGSMDLGNPQSFNRYVYALNNPLNLMYPRGLDYCKWDDGTKDDTPEDGGDDFQQCTDARGTWVWEDTVTVTAAPPQIDLPTFPVNTPSLSGNGGTANGAFLSFLKFPSGIPLGTQCGCTSRSPAMVEGGMQSPFNCYYSCKCANETYNSINIDIFPQNMLHAECSFAGTPIPSGTCPAYVEVQRLTTSLPLSPIEFHFDIVESCHQYIH